MTIIQKSVKGYIAIVLWKSVKNWIISVVRLIIMKDRFSDPGNQTFLKKLHNFHLEHGNYVKMPWKGVGIYLRKRKKNWHIKAYLHLLMRSAVLKFGNISAAWFHIGRAPKKENILISGKAYVFYCHSLKTLLFMSGIA